MRDNDTGGPFRSRDIPLEDLKSFVDDFPALLWRIEIARSRIEFLNNHPLHPLGDSARLFLQNTAFRKQMLLPEDAHRLDAFLDAVKEGRTMATVFRVHTPADGIMWLKLTGAVNSSDPRYYYGYLLDIGDTVEVITDIHDRDAAARQRIGNVPTPVVLVDHKTRRLKQANAAARELFGLPRSLSGRGPASAALYSATMGTVLDRILNGLDVEHSWAGRLEFYTIQGEPFIAEVRLRWIWGRQRSLVRISVVPTREPEAGSKTPPPPSPEERRHGRREILQDAPDLPTLLENALKHPEIGNHCEAIMLSDIHPRRNKVLVTGAGKPLQDMPLGEDFSYKGTIAEDIVRFNLEHLVVDDTLESIKPIDWALFIPRGIRSYIATPFYERKALRTVFILCSTEPNRFTELDPKTFDAVLTSLNNAIAKQRKPNR